MNSLDVAVPFLVCTAISICGCTYFEVCYPNLRISQESPNHYGGAESTLQNVCILLVLSCLQIPIPSSSAWLWPIAIWYLLAEVWFALSHRLMHSRRLYRFHKKHHTDTSPPTACDVLNCGVVELFLVNIATVMIGPVLVPANYFTMCIWIAITTSQATLGHSNLIGQSELHSIHHARCNVNYGTGFYLLDRLLGTFVD